MPTTVSGMPQPLFVDYSGQIISPQNFQFIGSLTTYVLVQTDKMSQ